MADEQRDALKLLNQYFPGCVTVEPELGGNRDDHLAGFPQRGLIRASFEYLTPKNTTGFWRKTEFTKNTASIPVYGLEGARKLIDAVKTAEKRKWKILPEIRISMESDDFIRRVDVRLHIGCVYERLFFGQRPAYAQNKEAHAALARIHKHMLHGG